MVLSSHTLSMHQNQTHVRHPYLFSKGTTDFSTGCSDVTLAIPQSEPVTDKNNSASRKLLVMIAEDNPCATPF
jgi:hypothetical protein